MLVANPSQLLLDLVQSSSLRDLLFTHETGLLKAFLHLLASVLQILNFL